MLKLLSSLQNLTYRDGFWLLLGATLGNRVVKGAQAIFDSLIGSLLGTGS